MLKRQSLFINLIRIFFFVIKRFYVPLKKEEKKELNDKLKDILLK